MDNLMNDKIIPDYDDFRDAYLVRIGETPDTLSDNYAIVIDNFIRMLWEMVYFDDYSIKDLRDAYKDMGVNDG